ncbi:sugar ABC transporter [Solirhodobacter olei]|uniref:sugar ABC transporter n=1 Tax=Solirhodobacter olei TaxID=2493082 RepID=UPI000FDC6FAE|nr:sugar ABC transporter [Solirhodobacter olei]
MIYTVECSYTDPASEAEWNDFYSLEKLPALISVTGFHSSQRLKALGPGFPTYLALHTVDGLDVLEGLEYREKGGGNFARWQQHITDWHRNLYDAAGSAPGVGRGEVLAVSHHGPDALVDMGLGPLTLQAVALERHPARRWLAKLPREAAELTAGLAGGLQLYAPMTEQLTSRRAAAASK